MGGLRRWAGLWALVFACGCQGQDRVVHFVTDPEKEGGYLLAVTQAAAARAGYRVEVEYRPWLRALQDVEDGRAEALLGAQYSDERARRLWYSEPIGHSDMVFFKLRETSIEYRQVGDLRGLTVGTIIGAVYTPEFDAASDITREPVADVRTNIRKLLARRMPLFLEKRSVVLNALKHEFSDAAGRIDALSPPLKTMIFFNGFSKARPDSPQKLADFNRGLAQIMRDGSYQRIVEAAPHE